MNTFENPHLRNLGTTTGKLPADAYSAVMKEIEEIKADFSRAEDHRKDLAGNIAREYVLTKSRSVMEPFLYEMARVYYRVWCDPFIGEKAARLKFNLMTLWVNYQRKHEFNPIHNHNGLVSFVCWMKIPYRLQDEMAANHVRESSLPSASMFSFVYTNVLGTVVEAKIPVDRDWEGTLLMFPALLNHQVYPFSTSDDYRISVSGNIELLSP